MNQDILEMMLGKWEAGARPGDEVWDSEDAAALDFIVRCFGTKGSKFDKKLRKIFRGEVKATTEGEMGRVYDEKLIAIERRANARARRWKHFGFAWMGIGIVGVLVGIAGVILGQFKF